MDCRNALIETEGDIGQAAKLLEKRSLVKAQKKVDRVAAQGIIEAYIHSNNRLGAIVEVNCESDFVARTDEFKTLAHDLAMQIAAQDPQFISSEEAPEGINQDLESVCLLLQPFIKDPGKTIGDIINENIAKMGENIKIGKFARFALEQ